MKNFSEIVEEAKRRGVRKIAIAGIPDSELLGALEKAKNEKLAESLVFNDAAKAALAVRKGEADILMKGNVDTKIFMGAVLDKDNGLRSGKLISHIAVIEAFGRLILITDGGICLQPTREEKVEIIKNALPIARALGIETPKVAILAAVEKVNPKMPETVDADEITKAGIPGCLIQGPLAVDNAISPDAARTKGISGPVVGQADILLVPSVLVGNIFAKGIMYFSQCAYGGIVAGTSRPVAFLSRSDTMEIKFNTISLSCLI